MSVEEKNEPPEDDRMWEENAASPAADASAIPQERPGAIASENASPARSARPWDWLLAMALVVTVFLVYQPCWHGGFLWDDDTHLLDNPVLKPGGLAKVWTPGGYLNYWPLTYTAYWLQFRIWGLDPLGFHLVNIALHAMSALLLWRILVQLRAPGAMFAAAIFAIHPVNVESVAWIAQLKNLLSLMFALLSVLFYVQYAQRGEMWRLALSFAVFLLSSLAKGMVLTLPVVLLAITWWQRGRIAWRDLLRVLPYLAIGSILAGIEVWTQQNVAAHTIVRADSFLSRAAIAGCAVWFYLWELLWPVDLCLVYPRWQIDSGNLLAYLPDAALLLILALAWWRHRTWGRPVILLLVCYVALLLPALGFVNIYFMRYSLVADHWQYAAMVMPCAVLAGAAATIARSRLSRLSGRFLLALGLLLILGVLSWRQSRMYADLETLYQTTIDRNPDCWLVHNNLGLILAGRGQVDEAIAHYRKALEIKPDYELAHNNLGLVLAGRGQVDEAITHYRKALEIEPDFALAHNNFGWALAGRGQVDEAITHYRKSLEIDPNCEKAHNNLGNALARRGRLDHAIAQYQMALEINPGSALAHSNLGLALAESGQVDDAIAQYHKALDLDHGCEEAHNNLGNALVRQGKFKEAIVHYRMALSIKPDYSDARTNLSRALAEREKRSRTLPEKH